MEITREISRSTGEHNAWKEDDFNSVSAQELFSYCDLGNKGYITRTEMERLRNVVPFSKQQAEQMFVCMGKGKNGEIDLDEFMSGFNALVEVSASSDFKCLRERSHVPNGRALSPIKETSNDLYEEFIDGTGYSPFLKSDERLRKIFNDLNENQSLIPEFEQLIEKISSEFEISDVQRNKLEHSLQTCHSLQNEQLEGLYENLERRMEEEKTKALAEEKTKNDKINRRLQEELRMKDSLLEEMINQQKEMQKKISELMSEEADVKNKNKVLLKERNCLERNVISTEKMLAEIEMEIKELSENDLETKKRRERSLNSLSREISLEEELMAAQIDKLRRDNKRLLDENDTKTFSDGAHDHNTFCGSKFDEISVASSDDGTEALEQVEGTQRRGSCLSDYLPNDQRISLQNNQMDGMLHSSSENSSISSELDCIGINDDEKLLSYSTQATWKVTCTLPSQDRDEQKAHWKVKLKVTPLREKIVIYPQVVENDMRKPLPSDVCDRIITPVSDRITTPVCDKTTTPVCDITTTPVCDRLTSPERVFKIILVGDSGVGKTSFIQRFCTDSFKTNFHSTIGIDFQVKSIVVNNRCISLQLWDTAGQERFRCISKQYFRKSDAVIVMYDVTSEQTFRNIRKWFAHIKENADNGAVILLLGNKIDARQENQCFVVSWSHGARVAEEYGALFFETSAKSGTNINESMAELSSLLQEKEDQDMEKALVLDEPLQNKKWRC